MLDRYAHWINKVHPIEGRQAIQQRLDNLMALGGSGGADRQPGDASDTAFSGRSDMDRPDACPEYDAITLQIITHQEAQYLFDSFMRVITNGSMYFDSRVHTLAYVRSRSSFLLAVILAMASGYVALCPQRRLHSQLSAHAKRLEEHVLKDHLKSIEIVQAFLLLANWSELPTILCRDKTWMYISQAIALAIELRLVSPLPYCIQSAADFDPANQDVLVRNAHRVCYMLFILDRSMAMVAGRHPIFPESGIFSAPNLHVWARHRSAERFDAGICASVSLRKLTDEVSRSMNGSFTSGIQTIDAAITRWRLEWAQDIRSTHEYDIIARFSTLILALILLRKTSDETDNDDVARETCGDLAFEVVCAAIHHYKTWTGVLNSATFDVCMVAFCAVYIIQSVVRLGSRRLSDWEIFKVATLEELIGELDKQSQAHHTGESSESTTAVEAMSRRLTRDIQHVLEIGQIGTESARINFDTSQYEFPAVVDMPSTRLGSLEDLNPFMFTDTNVASFFPDWRSNDFLPELGLPWNTDDASDPFSFDN